MDRIVPIDQSLHEVLAQYRVYRDKMPLNGTKKPDNLSEQMVPLVLTKPYHGGFVFYWNNATFPLWGITEDHVFMTSGTPLRFIHL